MKNGFCAPKTVIKRGYCTKMYTVKNAETIDFIRFYAKNG